MRKTIAAICGIAFAFAAAVSHAAWPDHAIRLIVPFPPGGSTDVVARRVAPKVSQILGQPVMIENIGGAGSIVGSDTAARANPDGYTLLLVQPAVASNVALHAKMPYDIEKDFVSVALMGGHPGLLVASTQTPYKTFADFIKYAKANPDKVTYASAGVGTFPHLTMELLRYAAGIQVLHVPYKGAGPAMVDLLGGRVDVKVDAYSTAIGHIKAGKLVTLAVTGKERIPQMPDIPTVAESGYPDFESSIWMGISAPAKTPPDIVAKLERAFVEASKDPEVVRSLNDDGIYMVGKGAKDLDALLKSEVAKWRRVVKAANIKAD